MAEKNILEQETEIKNIKEERKRLKAEQKAQRKEAIQGLPWWSSG